MGTNERRSLFDSTRSHHGHSSFLKELPSKSARSSFLGCFGSCQLRGKQKPHYVGCVPACNPELLAAGKKVHIEEKISFETFRLVEVLTSFKQTDELLSINDFIGILQKCRKEKVLAHAKRVHVHIQGSGLDAHEALGNFLVPTLVECGDMATAEQVFRRMLHQNEFSWTSFVQGYIDCGEFQHAFDLLLKMQENHVQPSAFTFQALVKACASLDLLERGQELHTEVVKDGFEVDPFVGSTLLNMYARCGLLAEALDLFNEMPVIDAITWTTLISGYAEQGFGKEALDCFDTMQANGIPADAGTFVCSLKGCAILRAICKGLEIHAEIVKEGLESNLRVGSTLVDMYVKCGSLVEASEVLEGLPSRDAIAWTALISGYAEHGLAKEALEYLAMMQIEGISPDAGVLLCSLKACSIMRAIDKGKELHCTIVKLAFEKDPVIGTGLVDMYSKTGAHTEAREVFNHLPVRGIGSWTALATGYVEYGFGDEALINFEQMQLEGVSHDDLTFSCSLKACVSIGAIDKGREMHSEIVKAGFETDPFIGSTLVDMYSKHGSLTEAQDIFDELPLRNVVTWSSLIAGYARRGEIENVFFLFEEMMEEGIRPEGINFLSVLGVCSHAGLVGRGQRYFESMSKDCRIIPSIEHLNIMVDLLGRAGLLEEAVAMVENMFFEPTLVTWSTLLGACRMWGNVGVGRHVFECTQYGGYQDSELFSLMSNIYLDSHMLEDAMFIEALRLNVTRSKEHGKSSIETSEGVRTVGALKHSHDSEMHLISPHTWEEMRVPGFNDTPLNFSNCPEVDAPLLDREKVSIAHGLIRTGKSSAIHSVLYGPFDVLIKATPFVYKIEQPLKVCRKANSVCVF